MQNAIIPTTLAPLPAPKVGITIRPGTLDDLPFIDALQKKQSKAVGFFQRQAIEGKIALGHVLVAETASERAGYLIGNDQYFKRDDVGCIFQINVLPDRRRQFIAAALLKAQFDRSAYGCRLYCCWCAQDIEANRFWESMGFVPLAFRAGSEKKQRVHIFWQKRIRANDTTTPWWFPSKTTGGAIRADRLVLPIPPGTHWSEVTALAMPAAPALESTTPAPKTRKRVRDVALDQPVNGMRFAVPRPGQVKTLDKPVKEKTRVKTKCDAKMVTAARELRDRYLEQVNDQLLIESCGKYDVSRALPTTVEQKQLAA